MTNLDLRKCFTAGVQDGQRFLRDFQNWLEDPMTARFFAMMGAAAEWHQEQMMKAINDEMHMRNHNLNYNRRQVYLDLLSVIDGLSETKE